MSLIVWVLCPGYQCPDYHAVVQDALPADTVLPVKSFNYFFFAVERASAGQNMRPLTKSHANTRATLKLQLILYSSKGCFSGCRHSNLAHAKSFSKREKESVQLDDAGLSVAIADEDSDQKRISETHGSEYLRRQLRSSCGSASAWSRSTRAYQVTLVE